MFDATRPDPTKLLDKMPFSKSIEPSFSTPLYTKYNISSLSPTMHAATTSVFFNLISATLQSRTSLNAALSALPTESETTTAHNPYKATEKAVIARATTIKSFACLSLSQNHPSGLTSKSFLCLLGFSKNIITEVKTNTPANAIISAVNITSRLTPPYTAYNCPSKPSLFTGTPNLEFNVSKYTYPFVKNRANIIAMKDKLSNLIARHKPSPLTRPGANLASSFISIQKLHFLNAIEGTRPIALRG
ncbi:hypothetical protein Q010_03740 [Pseudomonas aeruginosa 19660]|nr:hypothetical protein Q010_03740 [Pseudomonas aeruginosa 19660]